MKLPLLKKILYFMSVVFLDCPFVLKQNLMLGLITRRESKKFYSSYKKLLSLPKSSIQVLEGGHHEGIAITY